MAGSNNLYVLQGPHWQLPIYVWHFDRISMVRPASSYLTPLMRQAINDRFAEIGTNNGNDWFVTPDTLKRTARAVAGNAKAEDYISWTPERPAAEPVVEGMDEFFLHLAETGWAHTTTAGSAQVLYGRLCHEMLGWLAGKRQPVDLGFAILQPLPVRCNWQEGVRFKMTQSLHGTKSHGKMITWREVLARAGEWLEDPEMLMYDKSTCGLHWTLTVKHKSDWWRNLNRLERKRRWLRGKDHYFADAIEFLKKRRKEVLECLIEYLAQARRPCVEFRRGLLGRCASDFSKPRVVDIDKITRSRRRCSPMDLRTGKKVRPAKVSGTIKGMWRVYDIQQRIKDLRDRRADVDKPGVGSDPAAWVPLLDACEGVDPGVGMLGIFRDGWRD